MILEQALQERTVEGYRVENRSDFQALIAKGKSAGERLASFRLVSLFGGRVTRLLLTVDEAGNLTSREVRFVLG